MAAGAGALNLSLLSRGIGEVKRNGSEKVDVIFEPQDYFNFVESSHDRPFFLPPIQPRYGFSDGSQLSSRYSSKDQVHLPKTFTTRKGALLLFSEDLASRTKASDHRKHKTISFHEKDLTAMSENSEDMELKTVDDLAKCILTYGSFEDSGGLNMKFMNKKRRKYDFERQIRPGFSAKRYLSTWTKTWDDSVLEKVISKGYLTEKSLFYYNPLLPHLSRRLNDDMSHFPTPYKLMRSMLVSPGSLSGYTFYRVRPESQETDYYFDEDDEEGSRSRSKSQARSVKVISVKEGGAQEIQYGNLDPLAQKEVLTDLLVKSAVHYAMKKQQEYISDFVNPTNSDMQPIPKFDMKDAVETMLLDNEKNDVPPQVLDADLPEADDRSQHSGSFKGGKLGLHGRQQHPPIRDRVYGDQRDFDATSSTSSTPQNLPSAHMVLPPIGGQRDTQLTPIGEASREQTRHTLQQQDREGTFADTVGETLDSMKPQVNVIPATPQTPLSTVAQTGRPPVQAFEPAEDIRIPVKELSIGEEEEEDAWAGQGVTEREMASKSQREAEEKRRKEGADKRKARISARSLEMEAPIAVSGSQNFMSSSESLGPGSVHSMSSGWVPKPQWKGSTQSLRSHGSKNKSDQDTGRRMGGSKAVTKTTSEPNLRLNIHSMPTKRKNKIKYDRSLSKSMSTSCSSGLESNIPVAVTIKLPVTNPTKEVTKLSDIPSESLGHGKALSTEFMACSIDKTSDAADTNVDDPNNTHEIDDTSEMKSKMSVFSGARSFQSRPTSDRSVPIFVDSPGQLEPELVSLMSVPLSLPSKSLSFISDPVLSRSHPTLSRSINASRKSDTLGEVSNTSLPTGLVPLTNVQTGNVDISQSSGGILKVKSRGSIRIPGLQKTAPESPSDSAHPSECGPRPWSERGRSCTGSVVEGDQGSSNKGSVVFGPDGEVIRVGESIKLSTRAPEHVQDVQEANMVPPLRDASDESDAEGPDEWKSKHGRSRASSAKKSERLSRREIDYHSGDIDATLSMTAWSYAQKEEGGGPADGDGGATSDLEAEKEVWEGLNHTDFVANKSADGSSTVLVPVPSDHSVNMSPERSKSEVRASSKTPVLQRSHSSPLSDYSDSQKVVRSRPTSEALRTYRQLQGQISQIEGESQMIREQTEVSHITEQDKTEADTETTLPEDIVEEQEVTAEEEIEKVEPKVKESVDDIDITKPLDETAETLPVVEAEGTEHEVSVEEPAEIPAGETTPVAMNRTPKTSSLAGSVKSEQDEGTGRDTPKTTVTEEEIINTLTEHASKIAESVLSQSDTGQLLDEDIRKAASMWMETHPARDISRSQSVQDLPDNTVIQEVMRSQKRNSAGPTVAEYREKIRGNLMTVIAKATGLSPSDIPDDAEIDPLLMEQLASHTLAPEDIEIVRDEESGRSFIRSRRGQIQDAMGGVEKGHLYQMAGKTGEAGKRISIPHDRNANVDIGEPGVINYAAPDAASSSKAASDKARSETGSKVGTSVAGSGVAGSLHDDKGDAKSLAARSSVSFRDEQEADELQKAIADLNQTGSPSRRKSEVDGTSLKSGKSGLSSEDKKSRVSEKSKKEEKKEEFVVGKVKNTKELEELYGQPVEVPGKKTPAPAIEPSEVEKEKLEVPVKEKSKEKSGLKKGSTKSISSKTSREKSDVVKKPKTPATKTKPKEEEVKKPPKIEKQKTQKEIKQKSEKQKPEKQKPPKEIPQTLEPAKKEVKEEKKPLEPDVVKEQEPPTKEPGGDMDHVRENKKLYGIPPNVASARKPKEKKPKAPAKGKAAPKGKGKGKGKKKKEEEEAPEENPAVAEPKAPPKEPTPVPEPPKEPTPKPPTPEESDKSDDEYSLYKTPEPENDDDEEDYIIVRDETFSPEPEEIQDTKMNITTSVEDENDEEQIPSEEEEDMSEADKLRMISNREARAAKRAAAADKRRLDVERKRKEKEEKSKREKEEQERQEKLKQELEEQRKRKEEERRLRKQEEEDENAEAMQEELERQRKEQAELEREKRRKEEYARKLEEMKKKQQEEDKKRQEEAERRRLEEEELRKEEEEKMAKMAEEERLEYERLKKLEQEEQLRKEEEEKRRREMEAQLALEEARRLAEEMARKQAELEARLKFNRSLQLESNGMEHTQDITKAFVFSYFELLQWLGLDIPEFELLKLNQY